MKGKIPKCPSCSGDLRQISRGKWWCKSCDRVYDEKALKAGHV